MGEPIPPPPWNSPEWLGEATAWIEAELDGLGRELTGPIEEVKKWSISCVLKAPTDRGLVYLKEAVDLPLFVHEPRVTRALAARFPDQIPRVLASDDARRWALMDDFGAPFKETPPVEVGEAVFRDYGALQAAIAGQGEELVAMGCIERGLERLATQIGPLLADGDTRRVAADDIAVLERNEGKLGDLCGELAASPLPLTLVHGDLHMGNVAPQDKGYVFFDWTDACAAFPFFDMIAIYFYVEGEERNQLRDAYLGAWAEWAAIDELTRWWELAEPLCALHHVVSYQYLLNHIPEDVRSDLESARAYFIGKLVQALEKGD